MIFSRFSRVRCELGGEVLECGPDAFGAAFRRLAADTGVDDPMFVPLSPEPRLQQSGPRLVNVHTVTCAQAVAEHQDSRHVGRMAAGGRQQSNKDQKSTHVE
jgi:hypothetical protein